MKKLMSIFVSLFLMLSFALVASTANANSYPRLQTETKVKKPRGPVFRATKDQIKQAQAILRTRGFYAGDQSGKLDDDTRAGLRKYQAAENIKVTGTLNKVTLTQMGVELTERQKSM